MATGDNLGRFKRAHKKGQTPFTDTKDRCERLGYVPSHKRIAQLISAGLNLQVTRDELWDVISKDESLIEDLPAMPPLRRHLDADLADLSQISRIYAERKRTIEERVREKYLAKLAAADAQAAAKAVQPSAGAGEPPGGAPRAP